MATDREEAIKARAYQLWEEAGHVHGRHKEHWQQAEREIDDLERKTPGVTHVTSMTDRHGHDAGSLTMHGPSPHPIHVVPERGGHG